MFASLLACGGTDRYVPANVSGTSAEVALGAPDEADAYAAAGLDREQYDPVPETGFRLAREQPLSTFSVDVDTASYSNVRRFLTGGQLPPKDAVRIEELVNYFSYALPEPSGEHPIAIATELSRSPFAQDKLLLRIGLHAAAPRSAALPARNLVFLVDVSGSMQDENKLPLLKAALRLLVQQLGASDRVALVTYAGNAGVVLPPTPGDQRQRILAALDALESGGSTAGAAGIETAYALARANLRPGAVNRVLLATDGDFNVGASDRGSLLRLIERERDGGVFLTVLGFGMGNLQDATLELLADHGNGSYAYIDTLREARKVLVEQTAATLRTVAKDTKVQVELNPARVARYRLIGYENRRLSDDAFKDDTRDAGDMGDGHAVTALYELELVQAGKQPSPQLPTLRYQEARPLAAAAHGDELLTVAVRYKLPDGAQSRLLEARVTDEARDFAAASEDTRFAAAVAGFGMWLSGSRYLGAVGLAELQNMAGGALGADRDGYRHELLELLGRARELQPREVRD
jgi:Ca-activated chloride channel family protein